MCSELQVQIPAPHELSEVASNASNPNSWEIEVRGSQVQSQPVLSPNIENKTKKVLIINSIL